MRWSNYEAVHEMLVQTARVPDTYITISHLLGEGRETQVSSHPWDDMHEVEPWLRETARKLDPSPEGVKIRTRVLQKGGKSLKSVVSVLYGKGRGPQPTPAPSGAPTANPTPAPPLQALPGTCPSCVATQAILATKMVQVVDLEARLDHARRRVQTLEERLASTKGELKEARGMVSALQDRVAVLEDEQARAAQTLETYFSAHGGAA
ncbi:MAG: hypothetical protein ABIO70_11830 [Pseudomonadota bacterium]